VDPETLDHINTNLPKAAQNLFILNPFGNDTQAGKIPEQEIHTKKTAADWNNFRRVPGSPGNRRSIEIVERKRSSSASCRVFLIQINNPDYDRYIFEKTNIIFSSQEVD